MPAFNLSNPPAESDPSEDRVDLIISLTTAPSAQLGLTINTVMNRHTSLPYSLSRTAGEDLQLKLNLSDPGMVNSENLAKRLLRIPGVKKLKARRVCSRRGLLYEINLAAMA